ncbi:MAG TPA: cytochrome b/b6 domain-containing protein [Rhodanobacteraceae bacterium]|nr:cytochrome b/b6 domain-containing protein [Rhodanobacteraceae bacterium]
MGETGQATVWDLPTRLFHWTLVLLIAAQYASGEFGILSMEWHFYLGYATLALVVFRVLWGFAGSTTSRFAAFVRGPGVVVRYAREALAGRAPHVFGHNPIGGWSVLLLLASLFVQSVTGLFSTDDLTETGPLAARVSDATVAWMTHVHHVNRYVLLLLILGHVVAVAMHWVLRHENLVAPMWHGRAHRGDGAPTRVAPLWRALVLMAMSAAAVALLVIFGGDA